MFPEAIFVIGIRNNIQRELPNRISTNFPVIGYKTKSFSKHSHLVVLSPKYKTVADGVHYCKGDEKLKTHFENTVVLNTIFV